MDQDGTERPPEKSWADIAIRLALVALILYWSFLLLQRHCQTKSA
jgi:hypothetical protein